MASILNFANFTFTTEQIRALNELAYDDIIKAPEFNLIHTIYPGIVFDKEIGFITGGGLVGKAGQGCSPTAQTWTIGTRKVTWTPKKWGVFIEECYTDLEAKASTYSLKTGVNIADFTDTDYMAIVLGVLTQSLKDFFMRLVWFNDTLAENVTDGGKITDGVDITFFTILDGFFKQIDTQITANADQGVAITENAGVSYVAQALVPANVQTYLSKLYFGADMNLRGAENQFILCTQSFYDGYAKSITGVTLESLYTNLLNGMKTLTYQGVPIIPIPFWDKMIKAYYDNGTTLYRPHRAIYTTKDILSVGVDAESSIGDISTNYDWTTEKVGIKAKGKADAKLLNPDLFVAAL